MVYKRMEVHERNRWFIYRSCPVRDYIWIEEARELSLPSGTVYEKIEEQRKNRYDYRLSLSRQGLHMGNKKNQRLTVPSGTVYELLLKTCVKPQTLPYLYIPMEKTKHLKEILNKIDPYPLLGSAYSQDDFAEISLNTCQDLNLRTNADLHQCIQRQLLANNAQIGYGGYLEDRIIYQRSPHFQNEGESRSIHLGIDIWAQAGTPIHAPIDGKIHSLAYNDAPADYGATIILQHEIENIQLHTLYGHLSQSDLHQLKKRHSIPKGSIFCHLGSEQDNGGWVPHLHFQLILDVQGMKGDYPGVAAPSELEYYKENCPDPMHLFSHE